MTTAAGDPFALPRDTARIAGLGLLAVFGVWNGWTLWMMAANRTAVLPGGATRTVVDRGPFRFSRNPLYVGLILLDVRLALLSRSAWALVLVPFGIALLLWGAIVPESGTSAPSSVRNTTPTADGCAAGCDGHGSAKEARG